MLKPGSITSDIKWLLSDAGLDWHARYKVTTGSLLTAYATRIVGVSHPAAVDALKEYMANTPGSVLSDHGTYLILKQPFGDAR